MVHVKSFEFSPFSENTYVIWGDGSPECAIIDPGCYELREKILLQQFISAQKLQPVRLLNTHCHLDHVFGNAFVHHTWGILPEFHRDELPVIERFLATCQMYGIPNVENSPAPARFLAEGEEIIFGNVRLEAILTPGHSPASLSFYCQTDDFVIGGDVLFFESIGRTDLPGGHFETLIQSILTKIFTLPDETVVFSGHGPATTVRHEKENNPFL
jgi:hydroxyacylglutathione hydrolase